MKRFALIIAVGALLCGLALPASAQAPPGPTVRFSGEMRFQGIAWNNLVDFTDSKNGKFRDSDAFYLGRLRLSTIMESADKKARATWTLEVGDIEFGRRGGASGAEYGCVGGQQGLPTSVAITTSTGAPVLGADGKPIVGSTPALGGSTRVGRSSGGCLGNDGVNVETKHLNLWFEVPGVPGLTATIGAMAFSFLDTAPGSFFGDDGWGIKVNWKMDPVDVELYTIKISEGAFQNADDIDAYAVRVGVNVIKDLRLTGEVFLVNDNTIAGASVGDDIWFGLTAAAKFGDISTDAAFVWGQRKLRCSAKPNSCDGNNTADEKGWGVIATAAIPVGPINVGVQGWYFSGDGTQGPGGFIPTSKNGCTATPRTAGAVQAGTQDGRLCGKSDKTPMIADEDSYVGLEYVASFLFGSGTTLGGPGGGSNYTGSVGDMTGTYGIGAQAIYALTPDFDIGGGVAYIGATDADGPYGSNVIEVDFGARYRVNANLSFQAVGGVLFPDKGDTAWAAGWRARYTF